MTLYERKDSILGGTYWQYISSISFVIAGALFYIFLVHFYSTSIVGVFSLLSAISYLFANAFSLGLQQGIQHFISYHLGRGEDDAVKSLIKKFTIVALVLSVAAFGSLWLLIPVITPLFFHTNAYLVYLRLTDVEILSMVITNILLYMLLGLQNFKLNGLLNLVNYVVGYGLIIPLIVLNKSPLVIIYAWIIGYYLTALLTLYFIYGKTKRIKTEYLHIVKLKPVLKYSTPIFISGLVGYGATYVDRFVVTAFLNLSELGIYNFSLLIVNALSILVSPFMIILLSRLSEFYGTGDNESFKRYSLKASEILTAVYVPLALIIAALSPSVLLFLAKSSYVSGAAPITIILITSSLTVSLSVFVVTLQAIRKTKVLIVSSSIGLISNLLLSIVLIPRFGIDGAAVGYASLNITLFVVIYYFSRKYGTLVYDGKKMLKIYVSGFVTYFLMILVQNRLGYSILKLFIFAVTGIAVYLFLIRLTAAFNENDIDLFLGMLPERYERLKRLFKSFFV